MALNFLAQHKNFDFVFELEKYRGTFTDVVFMVFRITKDIQKHYGQKIINTYLISTPYFLCEHL